MKISILTGLVAISTVFASQIRDAIDIPSEYENNVAGGQWQDVNNLNQTTVYQGEDLINKKRDEVSNNGSELNCLDPIPNSVANATAGNVRTGCIGGKTNPDYNIYKGILCAFSSLNLEQEQQNGISACYVSPSTSQKWCGYCFVHNDYAPIPSVPLWNMMSRCEQASLCLDTIIHTSMLGYKPNMCINTLALSIYGPIGIHSYISN
ncbi:hypothetical protein AYI68_g1252 [Smittium mucronatum]|uniref:Uncharacterized protein n=1 Tax=Smittium mucronatum TaxID=133383 RepID=A0A1R0H5U7_9FUNG|nr:hypothetical protein AYI68_g1252 [Smittium mucronatum]